ncbi:hypothetical protein F5X68DRAFT_232380 [Plectosphaerella plurivora]|uniref:Integral membrane protein n=1 Tax=Plectosphaerella plurivora TaxID=936078 RepID=A0A9P8VBE9_9PEZI|nr:hypothetical protein F5X68DRAFT_232380 [Plectosphaerella plurivora]
MVMARGFLVPPTWRFVPPPPWVREIDAIMLGFMSGFALFTAVKAARQTYWCWRRLHGRLTSYILMIWICLACGITQCAINHAYQGQRIQPSFWLFFFQVIIWIAQTTTLILIIVNRVSLIMYSPVHAYWLKVAVTTIVTILNVSISILWIPGALQISRGYIRALKQLDRVEKSLFTVLDASLNILFIYLVRTKLVKSGLVRYMNLFYFNIAMVIVSVSLDVAVVAMVSVRQSSLVFQFRVMSLIVKLYIEMAIAGFIARIIRSSHHQPPEVIEGAVEFGPNPLSPSGSESITGSRSWVSGTNRDGDSQLPAPGEEIGPGQIRGDTEIFQPDRERRPSRLKQILSSHSEAV